MGINSLIFGCRKYCRFTPRELKQLIITVVIMGFIIGFNDRQSTSGIDAFYIFFMLFSMIAVAFSLFLKQFIQRVFMYKFGQNPEYNYSINGLLIGIVLIFASEGYIWFLPAGYTMASLLQSERLGKWRYGLKYVEHGRALAFGIMGLVLFTIILKIFDNGNLFLTHLININIAIAIYSMIPMPESDGLYILYARRWLFVFTLALVVLSAVLVKLIENAWAILFVTIAVAAVITIYYNIKGQPVFPSKS